MWVFGGDTVRGDGRALGETPAGPGVMARALNVVAGDPARYLGEPRWTPKKNVREWRNSAGAYGRRRVRYVPRETRERFAALKTGKMSKIIAVANQKGGVGKTTSAVNLAACLAYAGQRTLLVDLDPQGNATSGLGAEPVEKGGSVRLFVAGAGEALVIDAGAPGLSLVASSGRLVDVEGDLGVDPGKTGRLRAGLARLKGAFDYIIVDCPPSIGFLPLSALAAADSLLIPIQCEYYAMEGLAQILKVGDQVRRTTNPQLTIEGILLTMFDPRIELAKEVAGEVREHFPDETYETVIPRDIALAEAPSHGRAIIDYAPRARSAESYIELAREVIANGR